jgi:hypothetical protein
VNPMNDPLGGNSTRKIGVSQAKERSPQNVYFSENPHTHGSIAENTLIEAKRKIPSTELAKNLDSSNNQDSPKSQLGLTKNKTEKLHSLLQNSKIELFEVPDEEDPKSLKHQQKTRQSRPLGSSGQLLNLKSNRTYSEDSDDHIDNISSVLNNLKKEKLSLGLNDRTDQIYNPEQISIIKVIEPSDHSCPDQGSKGSKPLDENQEEDKNKAEPHIQIQLQDQRSSLDISSFLRSYVSFNGKNINVEIRKLCLVARAVLEKPLLLLLYEESLDFGKGVQHNYNILSSKLENTTIICIAKGNENLHAYDNILLMDAGCVVEHNSPYNLLSDSNSFLFSYLQKTDPRALKAQRNLLGVSNEDFKSRQDELSVRASSARNEHIASTERELSRFSKRDANRDSDKEFSGEKEVKKSKSKELASCSCISMQLDKKEVKVEEEVLTPPPDSHTLKEEPDRIFVKKAAVESLHSLKKDDSVQKNMTQKESDSNPSGKLSDSPPQTITNSLGQSITKDVKDKLGKFELQLFAVDQQSKISSSQIVDTPFFVSVPKPQDQIPYQIAQRESSSQKTEQVNYDKEQQELIRFSNDLGARLWNIMPSSPRTPTKKFPIFGSFGSDADVFKRRDVVRLGTSKNIKNPLTPPETSRQRIPGLEELSPDHSNRSKSEQRKSDSKGYFIEEEISILKRRRVFCPN